LHCKGKNKKEWEGLLGQWGQVKSLRLTPPDKPLSPKGGPSNFHLKFFIE